MTDVDAVLADAKARRIEAASGKAALAVEISLLDASSVELSDFETRELKDRWRAAITRPVRLLDE